MVIDSFNLILALVRHPPLLETKPSHIIHCYTFSLQFSIILLLFFIFFIFYRWESDNRNSRHTNASHRAFHRAEEHYQQELIYMFSFVVSFMILNYDRYNLHSHSKIFYGFIEWSFIGVVVLLPLILFSFFRFRFSEYIFFFSVTLCSVHIIF